MTAPTLWLWHAPNRHLRRHERTRHAVASRASALMQAAAQRTR
jgi:hypothetical protein